MRREVYCWDWYEWDAWTRVCSDMTETPSLPLTLIWLRRLDPNLHRYDWDAPKFFDRYFWVCRSSTQVCRIEKREQKFFGPLSHICASSGQGVSVILVSTVSLASQSYHCKLWFKRLTHISLSSTPRVSLISVSFGLFWRINYGWFQTWFLSKEIRKNCFSGPFFQKKMFQKFWFSDFLGIKSEINE